MCIDKVLDLGVCVASPWRETVMWCPRLGMFALACRRAFNEGHVGIALGAIPLARAAMDPRNFSEVLVFFR